MGKDTGTIKHEIEQTRNQLGDTVEALGYKTDVGARVRDNVQDRVDSVKGTLSDMADSVTSAVDGTTSGISGAIGEHSRNGVAVAGDTVSSLRDRATELSSTAGEFSDRINSKLGNVDVSGRSQRLGRIARENPIGLALTALSIGFLAGSLLPVSDVERQQLGPLGDKVVDQAQAATHDLLEAGKAVVAETTESVVSTALQSAQSHGHDVVASVKARAEKG